METLLQQMKISSAQECDILLTQSYVFEECFYFWCFKWFCQETFVLFQLNMFYYYNNHKP